MKINRVIFASLMIALCLLSVLTGFAGYQLGNSNGYQIGLHDGYQQGKQDGYNQGYSQGNSDGYNTGYNAAGGSIQSWVAQNCFDYPFLLLNTSQYIACHRYQNN